MSDDQHGDPPPRVAAIRSEERARSRSRSPVLRRGPTTSPKDGGAVGAEAADDQKPALTKSQARRNRRRLGWQKRGGAEAGRSASPTGGREAAAARAPSPSRGSAAPAAPRVQIQERADVTAYDPATPIADSTVKAARDTAEKRVTLKAWKDVKGGKGKGGRDGQPGKGKGQKGRGKGEKGKKSKNKKGKP